MMPPICPTCSVQNVTSAIAPGMASAIPFDAAAVRRSETSHFHHFTCSRGHAFSVERADGLDDLVIEHGDTPTVITTWPPDVRTR